MQHEVHEGLPVGDRRAFLRESSLVLLGLAGSGLPRISRAGRGEILHVRNYLDVFSLDPLTSVSFAEGFIFRAMYQTLLTISPNGTWDTRLEAAEYFEQLDPTHYEFRLKPGQMFTNGYGEMTADDVKFSFERHVDPANNAINAPDMGPLSHVEIHDRYSGTFVLRAPYAAFTAIAVAGSTGSILSRQAVIDVGGRFTTQPPSCSGPYRFKSWQAQRKTVLERNPQWVGKEAPFEEIHIYAMTDDKAAEMAFQAGQLDLAQISVETVDPFEHDTPPRSSVLVLPSGRNFWLGMNQENPALTDIRVRRAIQYAIDVEAVVKAGWFGLAAVSTGPIPEGMTGHRSRALIPPKGDPERARVLLREAGVTLPLRLRLDVPSIARDLTAVQVMQWSLKRVGIEVDIRVQDPSTFITIGREDLGERWRDVQLFFQNFVGGADPYYIMTWFISDQMGLWNWERFSVPEFDHLNQLAIATSDEAERGRFYRRMQDLMEESGCYRFVTNGVMPTMVRDTIEPAFQPDGYPLLRDCRPSPGVA
jgi:peptide/nickel transport system substrate-binding protein